MTLLPALELNPGYLLEVVPTEKGGHCWQRQRRCSLDFKGASKGLGVLVLLGTGSPVKAPIDQDCIDLTEKLNLGFAPGSSGSLHPAPTCHILSHPVSSPKPRQPQENVTVTVTVTLLLAHKCLGPLC